MNLWEIEPHKITATLNDKIIQFYGANSTRKTSVAAKFPKSLIFGFEKGYQCIDGVMAIPVDSWGKFKDYLRQLKDPRSKAKFETVVIDTTRIAYDCCTTYLLAQYEKTDITDIGTKGKGWSLLKKEFSDVLNSIPKMGYGLVLITHANEEDKNGVLTIKTDLDKVATDVINKLVDFQFYVRKEEKEENGNKELTVFAYADVAFADTKNRLRYFPKHFEFTYENLLAAYQTALDEEVKHGAKLDTDTLNKQVMAEPLEDLRNEVIELVKKDPNNEQVVSYISSHFTKKLSQTDDNDYDNLIAARDFLKSLFNVE